MEEELINYAGADVLCETSSDWRLYHKLDVIILRNNGLPIRREVYYEKLQKYLKEGHELALFN